MPRLTFNAVKGLEMTAHIDRDHWLSGALVVSGHLAHAAREFASRPE